MVDENIKKKILASLIFFVLTLTLIAPVRQIQGIPSISNISEIESDSDFKNLFENEDFGQKTKTPLKEISSETGLDIRQLNNYNQIKTAVIYDSVEYYLLNFTYLKLYNINSHQEDTEGRLQYNLNETISISAYASLPVVLVVYRNDTLETDHYTQVVTKAIVDENYKAYLGFSIDFTLDYYFFIDPPGRDIVVGPESFSIPIFDRKWEFDTPLDGEAILDKLMIPVYSVGIVTAGVSVGPEIDTDFSAKLSTNSPNITLSQNELIWDTNNSIQTFNYFVPEFFSENTVNIDFFDFYMDLILSIVFYLSIDIDLLLFNKTFDFPIFSFPIAKEQLSCENVNTLTLETSVQPSNDLPFVYGTGYWYSDELGDYDSKIEPGETIDFWLWATNVGNGSALDVNCTVQGYANVTTSGFAMTPILYKDMENEIFFDGFQFSIPTDYALDDINIDVEFQSSSVNGTLCTSYYLIEFPCYQVSNLNVELTGVDYYVDGIPSSFTNWIAGSELQMTFTIRNNGLFDIDYADIWTYGGSSDDLYPAYFTSSQTNFTSLAVGESSTIGFINISAPFLHDKGFFFMDLWMWAENSTHICEYDWYFAFQIFIPEPEIYLDDAWVIEIGDGDGIWEAGETVELEYDITNIGDSDAFEVTGYLTSENPDIEYLVPEVYFPDLGVSDSGARTRAVRYISLNAKNQTAYYTLHLKVTDIRGNEYYFEYNISTTIVEAPQPVLDVQYYDYIDLGDGDDIIEPGEYFLLYINVLVDNTALAMSGSAYTFSELEFYNASCYYGYVDSTDSWGDGFIVYVPLEYSGEPAYIFVDIFAESLAGRKINASAYLILSTIPKGDLTPPDITLLDSIPSTITLGNSLSFDVEVTEPTPVDEMESGLYGVFALWSLDGSDPVIVEYFELGGVYQIDLLTGDIGTLEFVVVAMDWAGNMFYLDDSGNPFSTEIVPVVTEFSTILLIGFMSIFALLVFTYKKIGKV